MATRQAIAAKISKIVAYSLQKITYRTLFDAGGPSVHLNVRSNKICPFLSLFSVYIFPLYISRCSPNNLCVNIVILSYSDLIAGVRLTSATRLFDLNLR